MGNQSHDFRERNDRMLQLKVSLLLSEMKYSEIKVCSFMTPVDLNGSKQSF